MYELDGGRFPRSSRQGHGHEAYETSADARKCDAGIRRKTKEKRTRDKRVHGREASADQERPLEPQVIDSSHFSRREAEVAKDAEIGSRAP